MGTDLVPVQLRFDREWTELGTVPTQLDQEGQDMTQVNLIATIPTPPEKNEAVTALLVEYQEVVVAEPGNLRFELYRDPAGTSVIVVERYASDEAFQAHCSTEANATLNARLAEVLDGGGSALQMLEAIDA